MNRVRRRSRAARVLPSTIADQPRCRPEHRFSRPAARPPIRPSTGRVDREQGQAHLPAEQPPPGAYARFPAADAHPGRARHPRRSPPQGPRAALGLTGRAGAAGRLPAHPAGRVRLGRPPGSTRRPPSTGRPSAGARRRPGPRRRPAARGFRGEPRRRRVGRAAPRRPPAAPPRPRPRLASLPAGVAAGRPGAAAGRGRTVVRPGRRPRLRRCGRSCAGRTRTAR